jgi:hypothetical protein
MINGCGPFKSPTQEHLGSATLQEVERKEFVAEELPMINARQTEHSRNDKAHRHKDQPIAPILLCGVLYKRNLCAVLYGVSGRQSLLLSGYSVTYRIANIDSGYY